jgi:four helix bundle protein
MTGRLRSELLERFLEYAVRMLKVAEELERGRRPRRVVDQITGSGTSPAAQMYEANEAVSRADFLKSLGWAAKELGETRFWLQLIVRMQWLPDARIARLLDETAELLSILKAMIVRTRARAKPHGKLRPG